MPEITAAVVKSLRDQTGLPMMDCKRALQEPGGDPAAAVEWLRTPGKKTMETRAGRETSSGRIGLFADFAARRNAMVELLCESAPVANHEDFIQLAGDLAKQLATGPGAASPEELLAQPSPSKPGASLRDQLDDLSNRIREVFKLNRIVRIDGACGAYAHHNGMVGVLLEISGGTPELAKDICMHIAAMRPKVAAKAELDPAEVAKEREILAAAARLEGKPEKIIDKMVEGRLQNFYAERVLTEQPFVKDDKKTVGQVAQAAGMQIPRFVHWEIGKG
jgi:elongation factor Ts